MSKTFASDSADNVEGQEVASNKIVDQVQLSDDDVVHSRVVLSDDDVDLGVNVELSESDVNGEMGVGGFQEGRWNPEIFFLEFVAWIIKTIFRDFRKRKTQELRTIGRHCRFSQ